MVHGWSARLLMTFFAMGAIPVFAGNTVKEDPQWKEAIKLQNSGEYVMAADAFTVLFTKYPDSQEAALRVARNQERAGLISEAISGYDVSNRVKPLGYWAEVGLYYQAILKYQEGDRSGGEFNVEELKKRFPDSRWTARGVALAAQQSLQTPTTAGTAELDGPNGNNSNDRNKKIAATLAIEQQLAREETAWSKYVQINKNQNHANDNERIQALDQMIGDFANTRIALQALNTKGHLLLRNSRRDEAKASFKQIIAQTSPIASNSRICQTAKTRLAALYHLDRRMDEAYAMYTSLADTASDPAIASNAALQAAGVFFETQQAASWTRNRFEYEKVRELCKKVLTLKKASPVELARAELMTLESYLWENRPEECLAAAKKFITTHDVKKFRRELSTAHLFAGESLQRMGDHDKALKHFRWITNQFEKLGATWTWDYLIQHTYYRVYDALKRSGASVEEIAEAADVILTQYPDSYLAVLVEKSEGLSGEIQEFVVETIDPSNPGESTIEVVESLE